MYGKSGFTILVWAAVVAPKFLTPSPPQGSLPFEQVWTAPPEAKRALHKVLALYVSSDGKLRSSVEAELATALRGLPATPAADVLSTNDYSSATATRDKLEAAGYDGIVSMRLLSLDDELALRAPVTYRLFHTYWSSAAPEYAKDPNAAFPGRWVRIETSSYSLKDGSLVWSGLSEPIEAADAPKQIEAAARAAAAELALAGVIPRTH